MNLAAHNAEDLDTILAFLEGESDTTYYSVKQVKDLFFQANDEEYVEWLFDTLKDYDPKVVSQLRSGNIALKEISKSNYTKQFLQDGGFVGMFNKEFERQKKGGS